MRVHIFYLILISSCLSLTATAQIQVQKPTIQVKPVEVQQVQEDSVLKSRVKALEDRLALLEIVISVDQGNLSIKSSGKITIESGTTMLIKSNATTSVRAAGPLRLNSGGPVVINDGNRSVAGMGDQVFHPGPHVPPYGEIKISTGPVALLVP